MLAISWRLLEDYVLFISGGIALWFVMALTYGRQAATSLVFVALHLRRDDGARVTAIETFDDITKRWTCSKCGGTVTSNVEPTWPAVEMRCPVCRIPLVPDVARFSWSRDVGGMR